MRELISRASATYVERRGLLERLAERGVQANGASGLNVWIPVGDETGVVGALLQRGWVVAPGGHYRLAGALPRSASRSRRSPRRRRGGSPRIWPMCSPPAPAAADSRSCPMPASARTASRPRAAAPTRCCAACSSTAPTPTRRCRPRPSELDARDRALAMRLSYGAVQRKGTLDHLIERLATVRPSASTRPCWRRCDSGCTSSSTWTARPTTRSSPTPSSSPRRRGARVTGSSTRCCAVPRARARRCSRRLTDETPEQAAAQALPPGVDRAPVVGGARRRRRPRADGHRQRARRAGAAREHARHRRHAGASWRRALRAAPAASATADGGTSTPTSPRRWCSTGRSTCTARRCGARAHSSPSRAPRCSSSRALDPRPGERVLDLCAAPGGQEHAPGRADGRPRRGRRGRAQPAPRRRARAHRAAPARARTCASRSPTRRSRAPTAPAFDRVLVDPPCSGLGTLQARADLRWRVTPEQCREMAGEQAAILAAGAARATSGWRACLLYLHDLSDRERAPDRRLPRFPRRLRCWRTCRRCCPRAALRRARPRLPADAAAPRPHGRLLHRPAAPELNGGGEPDTSATTPIDLGPKCPNCGEPWLRPTNLPGPLPLRLLPAPLRADVGVPQLRRALDDRADVLDGDHEVQQLRRLDAPSRMSATAWRLARRCWRGRVAPSILVGRLRPAARAGRGGARRGRARHPRRRDGRPLRAADHGRPAGRGGARRARARGGRDARRAPDDRAPRAPGWRTSSRPGPTRSRSTPRPPRTSPTRRTDPRGGGAGVGVAINPAHAGRRARRGRRGDRPRAVHDGQPRLGRAAVHRALARQARPACARSSATEGRCEVDGGIDADTAPRCRSAGANVFVAGLGDLRRRRSRRGLPRDRACGRRGLSCVGAPMRRVTPWR